MGLGTPTANKGHSPRPNEANALAGLHGGRNRFQNNDDRDEPYRPR